MSHLHSLYEWMARVRADPLPGFDIILISNFYAYPAFRNRFGVEQPNGTFQIPAPWQAGLGNGSAVGQFIGLLVSPPPWKMQAQMKLTPWQLNGVRYSPPSTPLRD